MFQLFCRHHSLAKVLWHPSGQRRTTPQGFAQHAYTSELQYLRIMTGYVKHLELDHLIFVPTLPNVDQLGDAVGIISLPHDAFEFI